MIAEMNVWGDILAILMIIVPVGFWSVQIAGNFATGRYYRKFIAKQWPHHDEIIPLDPKIMHGINLFLMITLGFSGVYLRFPFFAGGREFMKWIHFVCMIAVVVNAVMRVRYALRNDGYHFRITVDDIINAPKVILYYMFLKQSYPHVAKYNIMQKTTYGYIFPSLLIVQTITGLAMVWPEILLWWAADFAGGITSAVAWLRLVHFMSAMAFLMMTMIHGFLAITEDLPAFLFFFGLTKQKLPKGHEAKNVHKRGSQNNKKKTRRRIRIDISYR